MKRSEIGASVIILLTLILLVTSSTALAVSCGGSPERPAGDGNNGLKIEGDASGAKLKGVVTASFSELRCSTDYGSCVAIDGCFLKANAGKAKVAMRLSSPKENKDGESTEAFYVDLGEVVLDDEAVQGLIAGYLSTPIIEAFFGEDVGQKVYLKEFVLYTIKRLEPPQGAPPADFPAGCYGTDIDDTYTDFTAIADITLAVN